MGLSFSGALTPTGRTTTRANKAPTWSSTGNLGQTLGNKPFTANLLGTDPEGTTVKYGIYDGGVLPSGISLNTETGVLSGTPANNPGVKTFPIYITDGVDVIPQTFTLEIQNATPVWATLAGSLGTINENTEFTISLSATDENLDTLTFTKTLGTLPPGLTLATNGTISGTTGQVSQTTVYNFTVQVNDGATGVSSRAFSITVNNNINEPPVWSTAAGSLGILNEQTDFSYNLSVTDPDIDDTITYGVSSGTLPIGLTLNTATGVISGNTGVATGNVTYDFMISAQDGHTPVIYREFSITILNNINEPPVWTTAAGSIGNTVDGTAFSYTLVATDQNGDGITYSITSGALPTGMSLSGSTGIVSGTTSQVGTFNFTVTAADTNSGTTARAFSLTVAPSVRRVVTVKYGTNAAYYSVDNGVTWNSSTLPSTKQWYRIGTNGTRFIATNADSVSTAISADGVSWTSGGSLPSIAGGGWTVAGNSTIWVAIQSGINYATSANNGASWTSRSMPSSQVWYSIVWTGTQFVAATFNALIIATSPDGITWTQRGVNGPAGITKIGCNKTTGALCTVPWSGRNTNYSTDGINWTVGTSVLGAHGAAGATPWWNGVGYNGSVWFAVENDSTYGMYSSDAITWTRVTVGQAGWSGVCVVGNTFIIYSDAGNLTKTSSDGISWTTRGFGSSGCYSMAAQY